MPKGWLLDSEGFVSRFGPHEWTELTDDDANGMPDQQKAETAILDAEAEVSDYLSGRYSIPIEDPPRSLALRAYDVLRYRLHDEAPSEEVRQRYDDAIRWLRDVRDGRASIPGAEESNAGPLGDAPGGGIYSVGSKTVVFNETIANKYLPGVAK